MLYGGRLRNEQLKYLNDHPHIVSPFNAFETDGLLDFDHLDPLCLIIRTS